MDKKDGMNYAPKGIPSAVVSENEFLVGVIGLDHGHIYGMCNGLVEAGAKIVYVFDEDQKKVQQFKEAFSNVIIAKDKSEILENNDIHMIASACIPYQRAELGILAMKKGKHYFVDKAPITTIEQLELVKETIVSTGKRFFVYFSERLHVESAVFAGELIRKGAIGKVLQVSGFGPHKEGLGKRPDWFYEKEKYGGILCDIGCHQVEQFLYFANEKNATIVNSQIANYEHPEYPGLDDYGDILLVGETGTSGFFRLDWFTPQGQKVWGDGRVFILGTKGTIELRKYENVAVTDKGDHVFLCNEEGEFYYDVNGKVGYPFFGEMILDCINGTETAMTQEHILKAAELAVKAQMSARRLS